MRLSSGRSSKLASEDCTLAEFLLYYIIKFGSAYAELENNALEFCNF